MARVPWLAVSVGFNVGYAWILVHAALAPRLPELPVRVSDLLLHGLAYGIQAALLLWTLRFLLRPAIAATAAWLGAGTMGLLTEVLQQSHPPRSAEFKDLVADVLGATVVVLGFLAVRHCRSVFNRPPGRTIREGARKMEELVEESVCMQCREAIRPGARRCPSCLSWQSGWAGDAQHPFLELGIVVALVTAISVLSGGWLLLREKMPPVSAADPRVDIEVLAPTLVPLGGEAGTFLAITGRIVNHGDRGWRNLYMRVSFYDREGEQIDTFSGRAYTLVLAARSEVMFKLIDNWPIRPLADYASCTVEVSWAQETK